MQIKRTQRERQRKFVLGVITKYASNLYKLNFNFARTAADCTWIMLIVKRTISMPNNRLFELRRPH
jgi:hypothetical protein